MKIESIIKRTPGTEVVLDRTKYMFRPLDPSDSESPHVCDVPNRDHADMLLRIKEGYRIYKPGAEPAKPRIVVPVQPTGGGVVLSPIELAEREEEEAQIEADAQRAEAQRQMLADATAAAENMQRMNDADASLRTGDHDDDLGRAEPDPTAEVDGGPDDGDDEGEVDGGTETFTTEGLNAMSDDDVRTVYAEIFAKQPRKTATKASMVKAIVIAVGST